MESIDTHEWEIIPPKFASLYVFRCKICGAHFVQQNEELQELAPYEFMALGIFPNCAEHLVHKILKT